MQNSFFKCKILNQILANHWKWYHIMVHWIYTRNLRSILLFKKYSSNNHINKLQKKKYLNKWRTNTWQTPKFILIKVSALGSNPRSHIASSSLVSIEFSNHVSFSVLACLLTLILLKSNSYFMVHPSVWVFLYFLNYI